MLRWRWRGSRGLVTLLFFLFPGGAVYGEEGGGVVRERGW